MTRAMKQAVCARREREFIRDLVEAVCAPLEHLTKEPISRDVKQALFARIQGRIDECKE